MPTTTSFTGPHPPRTPGARGENMRVRLTKPEKLEIMKMCVEHGAEYSVPGGRGAFWEKIAQLASEKTGRDVRNPSQMVRKLLDMYIAGVGRTGELGVCMEAWKKRVDEVCILLRVGNLGGRGEGVGEQVVVVELMGTRRVVMVGA